MAKLYLLQKAFMGEILMKKCMKTLLMEALGTQIVVRQCLSKLFNRLHWILTLGYTYLLHSLDKVSNDIFFFLSFFQVQESISQHH